jgi:hypothetical protein
MNAQVKVVCSEMCHLKDKLNSMFKRKNKKPRMGNEESKDKEKI